MDQPSVPAGGTASILWDGPLSQPVVHWGQPSDATGARPGAAAGARPCQASQSQATGRDGAVLCEALGKLHKPLRGSSSGGLGWEGGRQAVAGLESLDRAITSRDAESIRHPTPHRTPFPPLLADKSTSEKHDTKTLSIKLLTARGDHSRLPVLDGSQPES